MDTSNRSANPSSAFLDGSISPRSSLPIAFLSNLQHSASAHRFNLFLSLSLFSLSGNSFKGYPSSCCPPSPSWMEPSAISLAFTASARVR